jgi:FAD/FMN-containing dehydrogenase
MSISLELKHLSDSLEGTLLYDDLHKTLYATDAYTEYAYSGSATKTNQDIVTLVRFAENIKFLSFRTAELQNHGNGIVVDVSKYFTKIVAFDPIKKTVTVQPGVIRDELNLYLKPHGVFFGPNTSTSSRCMIGGMVGNNSSGTTSIRYGVTGIK